MNTLETLVTARALLSDPARWTKELAARDENGASPRDLKDGVCFCALGVIWRLRGSSSYSSAAETILAETVRAETAYSNVVSWNDADATTHADVLRVFDAAIERARQP